MKQFLIDYFLLIIIGMFIAYALIDNMINNVPKVHKYRIEIIDEGTYYTDSFRMYGNNLIFDADGKQVIVNTDYIITSDLEKVPD